MWSAGKITSKTLFCQEGFKEWIPLIAIQGELEPPASVPEMVRQPRSATEQRSSWGCGKAFAVGCLGVILLIALLAIVGAISGGSGGRSNNSAPGLETRGVLREGVEIRTGPGADYPLDRDGNGDTGNLVPGETLYVLEERDGWIHFRSTPEDVGWSGWVRKNQTVPR